MKLTKAGQRRLVYLLAVLYVTGITFWSYSSQTRTATQRRHDACISRQRLYDGQVEIVEFLADEFHATRQQRIEGFERLHKKLKARPNC